MSMRKAGLGLVSSTAGEPDKPREREVSIATRTGLKTTAKPAESKAVKLKPAETITVKPLVTKAKADKEKPGSVPLKSANLNIRKPKNGQTRRP
jgi:hypothetical protein